MTPFRNSLEAQPLRLTTHAAIRMQQRGVSRGAVDAVLAYGRRIHAKAATFCVVGRKEAQRCAALGIDLSRAIGLQVLLSADESVITVYRSHNLHAIKAGRRHRRHGANELSNG